MHQSTDLPYPDAIEAANSFSKILGAKNTPQTMMEYGFLKRCAALEHLLGKKACLCRISTLAP